MDQSEDRCWIYNACSNQWEQSVGKLIEKRQNAVGKMLPYVLLGTERPWILGGEGASHNVSSSTEFYTGTNWVKSENNNLQEEKYGACAAKVNSTTLKSNKKLIVLIGGKKTYREVESFYGEDTSYNERIKVDNVRNILRGINNNTGNVPRDQDDEWSWLNHGRYFHSCDVFPMIVVPEEGHPYSQEAIIAAGKYDYNI